MPLDDQSFTIEFWFYATALTSTWDYSFAGQYEASRPSKALFLNIRNGKLFFSFYKDPTAGNTSITENQWYHAGFVYDIITGDQIIYLRGIIDGSSTAAPLQANQYGFTVGGARIGGSTASKVYFSGYIDHFIVTQRPKAACEIFIDANLACRFTFDSNTLLDDSGPNGLAATTTGSLSLTNNGRVNQAIIFTSSLSYILVHGVSALRSTIYTAFTISMWINPSKIIGGATLIHVSTQSNGLTHSFYFVAFFTTFSFL